MDFKSPVTVLKNLCDEHSLKQPTFIINYDGTETGNPMFKYEVRLEFTEFCVRVFGRGYSKKDAKQNAATKALIEVTNLNLYDVAWSSIGDWFLKPNIDRQARNVLANLCKYNNLSQPIYKVVKEDGFPYAKVYTVKCLVSSYEQTGIASSIKMAKRLAAQNVISHLSPRKEPTEKLAQPTANLNLESEKYKTLTQCCSPKERAQALKILNNFKMKPERKVKLAMNILHLSYEIKKLEIIPDYNILILVIDHVDPQIFIIDCTLEDLYIAACGRLSELFS